MRDAVDFYENHLKSEASLRQIKLEPFVTPSVRQRSATRDMSELMRLLGNFDDQLGTNLIEEFHKAIQHVDSSAFDGSGLPVRRICLNEDVFAAMIGWLVRGGWADGLGERPVLSARPLMILADKNLGGGRRVRFVPMSASGFQIFGDPP